MLVRFGLRGLGRRLLPRGHEGSRFDTRHWALQHKRYSSDANIVESSFPCVDIPHLTINEFIWENVDQWLDRTAIVSGVTGRNYTYRELREKCRRFSVSVRHLGLEPGTRLAMIMPNVPDYPVAVLGALEAGLVVNLINDMYLPGEVSMMLLDTDPRALVCLPVNYPAVVEAVRLAGVQGYKSPAIIVAQTDCDGAPEGTFSLEQMTGPSIANVLMPPVPVDPCTPAVIPFSSGTSGLPKGVVLSHRNLVANQVQVQHTPGLMLQELTTEKFQDIVAAILPFSHIYGLQNTLFGILRTGSKVVTLARFTGPAYIHILKHYGVTLLPVAPPIVAFLAALHPDLVADSLRTCRTIVSASAPVCKQHATELVVKAGHALHFTQAYGLTETSPALTLTPIPNDKMTSVGKLVPNTRAKVVHVDNGRSLGPNEHGELCFQGPQIMLGYYHNTQATEKIIDKSGWLHTGDVGFYDKSKYFFVDDRIKDLIKVKGLQVAPAELEECLRSHPDVNEAAVIGVPCKRAGEVPFAFVCPKDQKRLGCKMLEESIKEHVKTNKAPHKHLSEVRVISALPKNVSGKIMRRTLKEMAAKTTEYKNKTNKEDQ